MNYKEYHRNYYYKRKQKVISYLGGKCVKCGSVKDLQVDHIDKTKKSFNVNKKLTLSKIKEELKKCQLLCKPCHRKKNSLEMTGFTHGTIYAWQKKKCSCIKCYKSKRLWHRKRNQERRIGKPYKERF